MRSFEIFVAPDPHRPLAGSPAEEPAPPHAPRQLGRMARQVLDVFIEGANVTARISDTQAVCVLRDLGAAIVELKGRARGKKIVRFYDEPWELCVERLGDSAALSVYRSGADPRIAVYDRLVPFGDVIDSVGEAISSSLERAPALPGMKLELSRLNAALREAEHVPASAVIAAATLVSVEIDRDAPMSLGTEFRFRAGPSDEDDAYVERTDLHALLFTGKVRADVRGRTVELGEGHPFLVAERFLELARELLEAWERGQAIHLRSEAGSVVVGARLGESGVVALTLGGRRGTDRTIYTFPSLQVTDVVHASIGFGRALVRAVLRRDRSQAVNLRLSAFRRELRDVTDALREVCRTDAKVNPLPDPYRAFATEARRGESTTPPLEATRLRYTERWRAMVPGIDLRATFLCGERLIIGAQRETFCLHRTTGEVLWRAPTEPAISVVTPAGIARLGPTGALCVHDFGTGEVTLRSWVAPRLAGAPGGAVVNAPGLPRLLIVTEGEHHLVAIELTSGEPRWRFPWGRRGTVRMRRAGKLLYVTCGDSALTALDVLSGSIVWRMRDRLRFRAAPTFDHDVLFAVAGGLHCRTVLHATDAFSGESKWSAPVEGPSGRVTVEGPPLATGDTVAIAVRDRRGLRLVAFDRESGRPRWDSNATVAPVGTSWLAVDDLFIGNCPTGELVAIEARTGALRYRQVLGTTDQADVPRRLEPVLRSGALFVPHTDVHVFRPGDGTLLGQIGPCDAIADLLRVDEKCDVYVAEESGHVASFGAGPRLSLVRT